MVTQADFADTHEPEYDEKMVDVEAREPSDQVFGGSAEMVRVLSGSPARLTETIAGILRRCYSEGRVATSWQCSSAAPNRI